MKTRVTLQLLDEMARFDLRWSCDDCAQFTGERCAHGWPGGQRRRALSPGEELEFCKEYDGG